MLTRLVRPPVLRHSDAEASDRRATWLELFFDLVFAAAVADVATVLSTDYSLFGLFRFGFLFFLIWWAWIGHTFFSTRFDNDDLVHRILTLGQMFAVAVMSVNARADWASREAAGFVAGYGVLRLLLALQYRRVLPIEATRRYVRRQAIGIALGALLWVGSALVPTPGRPPLWAAALLLDVATPWLARRTEPFFADPAHLPERFGLFTLILLGESVVALMAGMRHQEVWSVPAASAALLGLLVAFLLWWAYFDVLGAAGPKPARTERESARLRVFGLLHLPLCGGIAVSAVGVQLIVATSGAVPLGGRAALLVGSVAVVMLSLGGLAATAPNAAPATTRQAAWRHAAVVAALGPLGLLGGRIDPPWLLLAIVGAVVALIVNEHRWRSGASEPRSA